MMNPRLLLSPLLPWKWARFYARDDSVMGGVSQSQTRVDREGSLLFEGVLRTENNGGFASVKNDMEGVTRDALAGGRALILDCTGDGREYCVRAQRVGQAHPQIYYSCSFKTERGRPLSAVCPVADFVPLWQGRRLSEEQAPRMRDAAELASLGLMISASSAAQVGDFALELRSISVG
jgi:NADH dehydrogenase [ubiquinone] 1 alpha subcomplex assembly factor 1